MKFALPSLDAVGSTLAQKPEIALESQVFVSPVELVEVGRVVTNALGVATWLPRPGAEIAAGGMDLHLRAEDGVPPMPSGQVVLHDPAGANNSILLSAPADSVATTVFLADDSGQVEHSFNLQVAQANFLFGDYHTMRVTYPSGPFAGTHDLYVMPALYLGWPQWETPGGVHKVRARGTLNNLPMWNVSSFDGVNESHNEAEDEFAWPQQVTGWTPEGLSVPPSGIVAEFPTVGQVIAMINGWGLAGVQAQNGPGSDGSGFFIPMAGPEAWSAPNPRVVLDVDVDGVADTAVAALTVPSWVADQGVSFPVGASADFAPQGVGNEDGLVTAVNGVESVANLPANTEFTVWASPTFSNFVEIGYKRSVSGPYQVPGSVEIADRYKSAAVIKKGRSESAELDMQFVHVTSMGGLARYNGQRVSVWVKIVKDKQVHTENVVYAGYRPESSPTRGDGNDEVMEQSTGPYESFLTFVAP